MPDLASDWHKRGDDNRIASVATARCMEATDTSLCRHTAVHGHRNQEHARRSDFSRFIESCAQHLARTLNYRRSPLRLTCVTADSTFAAETVVKLSCASLMSIAFGGQKLGR